MRAPHNACCRVPDAMLNALMEREELRRQLAPVLGRKHPVAIRQKKEKRHE
ncbi:hypothetical protein PXU57_003462 [Salmonella enterica subsp. enterica]|nr:hypothetical protein [Salmonella enterica subsp. enterica]